MLTTHSRQGGGQAPTSASTRDPSLAVESLSVEDRVGAAAFASMLIQKPEHVPDSLLRRIAHKHASLASGLASTWSCTTT
jgi:hypothetical protein